MRHSSSGPARIAFTDYPVALVERDWTETASLILTAVGLGYFVIHFAVAFARGAFS